MRVFSMLLLIFLVPVLLGAQELTPLEQLGKEIYFDKISSPQRMSCATCHAPETGFTGPIPGTNLNTAVYPGAIPQRFGNRKPPSASYASFSPNLDFDGELFFGGNFWDGRATGWKLDSPTAEQAIGPFLNPVEQNMPSEESVLMHIENSKYADLWGDIYGTFDNYANVGLAVAAFEASSEVNPFTSKFDYWLNDMAEFTPEEEFGWEVFNSEKSMCSACHISESVDGVPPMFTDFTFDNLGIPKNPDNPFYEMDEVYLDDGTPVNPQGDAWIDKGLGGFLKSLTDPEDQEWRNLPYVSPVIAAMEIGDLEDHVVDNMGKHKVPSLRNVAKAPSKNFPKVYGHNGYFKSLKEIVHFYNTRDVQDENWPEAEISATMNVDELGNLGLSEEEEDALVAFMHTLSDGYKPDKKALVASHTTSMKPSFAISGPNPFNPSTAFSYTLPNNAMVSIGVYDVMGRSVSTLVTEYKEAGEYSYNWNASDLPSGTYFVRLATQDQTITQKVLLMK